MATAPPVVDGVLDDAVWGLAEPAANFVQQEPAEGAPATERTEVRIVSDGTNLYVGVMCFDSDPGGILARELRRDDPLDSDDTFAFVLDTFHDHRNGFLFRINPRGAQFDALITEEGRHVNTTWREDWEVETHIGADGWSAEFKIPLRSIRFSTSAGQTEFGIEFERVIRRKNEFTYWASSSRDFSFHQVSRAGHLAGVEGLRAESRFRLKPYAAARVSAEGAGGRSARAGGNVGIEDFKYSLTPALTFDLTVNTDFAQTEVDEQVVNFDRVPVFFPEKRDFFLEGAGVFEFGLVRGEGPPEVKLYHSRKIGLSDEGEAVPILGGAKLAGKLGEKFTLGLLSVQTDRHGGRAGDNFSVVRLQRNVLSRSSVGMFATSRQGPNDFNRVVGIDQNFVLLDRLSVYGMAARSFTTGVDHGEVIALAGWQWNGDLLKTGFDYYTAGANFRSDLGFMEWQGIRKYGPHINIAPRPRSGPIRQFTFGVRLDHYRRLEDNTLLNEVYHVNHSISFQNGSGIRMTPHRRTEDLRAVFRLPGGLVVPPGRYAWWYFPLTYSFNPSRKVTGSVQYRYEPGYFGKGGLRQTWNVNPVFRLSQYVSARLDYGLNRLQLPGSAPVNVHLANARLDVSFNREWLTSTIFQYSNLRDLVGVNVRLRYRYGPNHDLFVVVNSVRSTPDLLRQVNRSLTMKLTRSFDF